jgi:hypothetical protein
MTAPVVRAAGTPVHFSNDTSRPVQIPATAQPGDQLFIVVSTNGAVTSSASPVGWVPVSGSPLINTTFDGIFVWTHTCGVGEPGTSVTVGNFSGAVKGVGVCLAIENTDPAHPVDVALVGSAFNTLGTSRTAPSTTTDQKAVPILIATDRASATVQTTASWTWPTGFTNVVTNQGSTSVNTGEAGIGIAVGTEVAAASTAGGGTVVGNSLTHVELGLLMVRSYSPPAAPQLQIQDDSGWHTVDIVGVGEDGVIKAVTLVEHLSGLHVPDLLVDFAGGVLPSGQFTVSEGVTVEAGSADPDGTSGFGANLTPDPSTGYVSLTKADLVAPYGKAWASIKVRFRCTSLPPTTNTYDNLFEIGNELTVAPKGQFTVYWNNRVLYADFNTEDAVNLGLVADTGWHTLEARVFFGSTTYTASVRIDGGTPINMTSAANKTASVVGALWMGYPETVGDYSRDIARLALSVADDDPGWLA